jgi:hypothetical protein
MLMSRDGPLAGASVGYIFLYLIADNNMSDR